MATIRLLRTSRALNLNTPPPHPSSSSSFSSVRCASKPKLNGQKGVFKDGHEKRGTVAVNAAVAASDKAVRVEPRVTVGPEIDLGSLVGNVASLMLKVLKPAAVKRMPWKLQVQMFIERVIIDCRFFALLAVGGSLLGSILCFVEGCFIILESYLQYFHSLSQKSDQGHVVHLLIEAIDMFLVGTAMLIFGVGMYVMFVGSKNMKGKLPSSNLFGLFRMRTLPTWIQMQSVSEAKSRIGHAVVMILQAGVLEKFKSIPLVTGFDLACFSGALLVSSACIFLLSRLAFLPKVAEEH